MGKKRFQLQEKVVKSVEKICVNDKLMLEGMAWICITFPWVNVCESMYNYNCVRNPII